MHRPAVPAPPAPRPRQGAGGFLAAAGATAAGRARKRAASAETAATSWRPRVGRPRPHARCPWRGPPGSAGSCESTLLLDEKAATFENLPNTVTRSVSEAQHDQSLEHDHVPGPSRTHVLGKTGVAGSRRRASAERWSRDAPEDFRQPGHEVRVSDVADVEGAEGRAGRHPGSSVHPTASHQCARQRRAVPTVRGQGGPVWVTLGLHGRRTGGLHPRSCRS